MNVFITGTSSGIGYGLALEYLKQGVRVYGISRRITPDLTKHKDYHHLRVDLTDSDALPGKIRVFLNGVTSFDVVVLNAGILGDIKLMSEIGVDGMKRVMEINVWANKALLDVLFDMKISIKQVVGMSSMAALRSTPGWGPYSMSKAGLDMLMNIYAKEVPDTHFSAIAPGLVDSEIQEQIYNLDDEEEKYPAVKRLTEARYTNEMPDPNKAAPKLISAFEKALQYNSGMHLDIREM
jgi:NAD(P)-dependent dehydrogenase (short-subunit alcohol dehydrogenase family)